MVNINISIEKKHLYVLGLFVLTLIGAGLIYSYQLTGVANPEYAGHSINELTFVSNSVPTSALTGTIPTSMLTGDMQSNRIDFSYGITGDVVVNGGLRMSATASSDDGTTLATRGYLESIM